MSSDPQDIAYDAMLDEAHQTMLERIAQLARKSAETELDEELIDEFVRHYKIKEE